MEEEAEMNAFHGMVAGILLGMVPSLLRADPPKPLILNGHTKEVTTLAWSSDGKRLATASDDRTIRVWDSASGKQTGSLLEIANEGFGGPVVAFTADLKIAAINYWGDIKIRTIPDGKELRKIDPLLDRDQPSTFRPDVYAMAFSPDGKRLVTGGATATQGLPGGIVVIWDSATGKMITKSEKLATAVGTVAWNPDGKQIAAGTNGVGGELPQPGEVWVWNADTGKVVNTFKVKPEVEYGEWASAGDVAWSNDGKKIAAPVTAGSRSSPAGLIIEDTGASVRVWDLATGKDTLPVKGLKTSVGKVAFSPDGKSMTTGGKDKVLRLWNVENGKELAALSCPDRVSVLAFSPDGKSLAVGSQDGSVRIWLVPPQK